MRTLLEIFGGFWVTPDPSLNREHQKVLFNQEVLQKTIANIARRTGRRYDENGFASDAEADEFFYEEGIAVKKYGQDDLHYKLSSIDKVGLEQDAAERLEQSIKKYLTTWVLSLR